MWVRMFLEIPNPSTFNVSRDQLFETYCQSDQQKNIPILFNCTKLKLLMIEIEIQKVVY